MPISPNITNTPSRMADQLGLPPFVRQILGVDDPQSQVLGMAQPLGVGVMVSKQIPGTANWLYRATKEDIPRAVDMVTRGNAPDLTPIVKRAMDRNALKEFLVVDSPNTRDVVKILPQDPQYQPFINAVQRVRKPFEGGYYSDSGIGFVNLLNSQGKEIPAFQTAVTTAHELGGHAGRQGAKNIGADPAEAIYSMLHNAAQKSGLPISDLFYSPDEAQAELVGRWLAGIPATGGPYANAMKAYLEAILRSRR